MNWNEVIDRLQAADIQPIEEIYMEHYGKVLATERTEFRGRHFRCTYGVIRCGGLRIEIFLFPSETHLNEFLEVIGDDPWYIAANNAVLHFPECDPSVIGNILDALDSGKR